MEEHFDWFGDDITDYRPSADLNAKCCECRKLMAELDDARAELSRKDGVIAWKDGVIADWQEWGRRHAPEHG